MILIGESFVGDGANAAHTNIVLGRKDGPVAAAWATALATPSAGHVPFMTVLRPSVPVKPFTLFVSKAAPAGELHERAIWGSAQAGLAQGVADAVAKNLLQDPDDLLIIAAVWVNPAVDDLDESYRNQRDAAHGAIKAAIDGTPTVQDVLQAAEQGAYNPFYNPGDSR
ncbi:formaldehyde-activating enzyme [Kutzneria buriramensis]|uniref:5,6,7,8-tetrahydromethanopterin hydro-lyase n=1 Tax=Kutzneria buriramensis TaxID=1045776 RepID=A0A3E0HFT2_9PSEU|nr:formaldehyde-activating enzyme [Kutzneria buriramensis]REH44554.1 5,6,7,8-tetrahydromethanopterin hydro-lyase [Kutzneria buriramensis]